MRTVAVVPIKGFSRAKTRLAAVLGPDDRAEFAQRCAIRVLDAIDRSTISACLVCTDDPSVVDWAAARGVPARLDTSTGLAGIVDDALVGLDADAAVIIMADLPQLDAASLDDLLAALGRAPAAVAPDRRDAGTNALALRLPAPPTHFGREDSFRAHLSHLPEAQIVRTSGLALDVDLPEDLAVAGAHP